MQQKASFNVSSYHGVRWQKWCQMFLYTNGAHSRTTSAMRNAKCFVQVKMTNVCSNESWTCKADLKRMVCTRYKLLHFIPEDWQYYINKSNCLRQKTTTLKDRKLNQCTCAFMLAPSMYTWPPLSWIILQISSIPSSYTPWVEGYVTYKIEEWSIIDA